MAKKWQQSWGPEFRSPVWGENTGRRSLQSACDAERPMPYAWRCEHGSSDGRGSGAFETLMLETRVLFRRGQSGMEIRSGPRPKMSGSSLTMKLEMTGSSRCMGFIAGFFRLALPPLCMVTTFRRLLRRPAGVNSHLGAGHVRRCCTVASIDRRSFADNPVLNS